MSRARRPFDPRGLQQYNDFVAEFRLDLATRSDHAAMTAGARSIDAVHVVSGRQGMYGRHAAAHDQLWETLGWSLVSAGMGFATNLVLLPRIAAWQFVADGALFFLGIAMIVYVRTR
ncbi:hypothetical protein GCM10010124_08390 [Pilimelia terevasa]|uniref:Uncharacterized protein n=1 Tax=Pilimelia terevasa TaxID=53372 RepID=A0A8J3BKR1_9ACTN|nr:hypothetical protein [Pilimelia terevasa]GGK18094.1 hypothetical protein GCM10010124_08390 [Pilimelia terevasa]